MSETISPIVFGEDGRAIGWSWVAVRVFNKDNAHPPKPPSQVVTLPDQTWYVWKFDPMILWAALPMKEYNKMKLALSIQCGNIGVPKSDGSDGVFNPGIYLNIYDADRPSPPSRKASQEFGHVYALEDLYSPVPETPAPDPIRDFLVKLATTGVLPGSSYKYPNRCLSGALVDASGLGLTEHKLIRGIRELLPDTAFFHTLYHRGLELEALSDVRNHLDNLCGTKHDWPHRTCWLPATPPERKIK